VQEYRCAFCGSTMNAPKGDIFVNFHCACGAYGQTDFLSEKILFPGDAAMALDIERMPANPEDLFDYKEYLDFKQGDFKRAVEGQAVTIFWAKLKQIFRAVQ
jgi:hypothetical protein